MKTGKIIYFGVTFLQVTLLFVVLVLEYLAGYKAGLAQHLYFKKVYYLAHYYQGFPLILHLLFLLVLSSIAVNLWRRIKTKNVVTLWKYLILLVMFVISFLLPYARSLHVYVYLLMTLQISMLLEVVSWKFILRMHGTNS